MEKDLPPENHECVTVIEGIFDTRISKIVGSILHENSPEVATAIAGVLLKS